MATSPDVRQRACLREMDVILLKARNEKREFTPAESQEFERLTGEFDKLDEDRHKFPDSGLLRSVTYHPDGAESSDDPTHRDAIFGKGGRLTSGRFEELQQRCGMDATDWRGFSGAEAEYFQVLASQRWDPRLTKRAGQSTLIDSEGGFGVPAPACSGNFQHQLRTGDYKAESTAIRHDVQNARYPRLGLRRGPFRQATVRRHSCEMGG